MGHLEFWNVRQGHGQLFLTWIASLEYNVSDQEEFTPCSSISLWWIRWISDELVVRVSKSIRVVARWFDAYCIVLWHFMMHHDQEQALLQTAPCRLVGDWQAEEESLHSSFGQQTVCFFSSQDTFSGGQPFVHCCLYLNEFRRIQEIWVWNQWMICKSRLQVMQCYSTIFYKYIVVVFFRQEVGLWTCEVNSTTGWLHTKASTCS